jgi:F-type H+-transporting ATPase subunit b
MQLDCETPLIDTTPSDWYKRVFRDIILAPSGRQSHATMQSVIVQVGNLLLGSLPTLILFILLILAYQFLVQGPLSRTLAERRARTTGAAEEANRAIAAAEQKAADYALKLRHARAEVFKAREERLKQWAEQRDTALAAARNAAMIRVLEAKVALENDAVTARHTLMAGAEQLAEQVVRAVMPAAAGSSR